MYQDIEKFYKNKRVFITGHTGFKGTWLCMLLENMGAIVCGYSLPKEDHSFFVWSKVQVAVDYEANILDDEKLNYAINEFKPEILIHLASHASLEGNYSMPAQILLTNTVGVIQVLECVRNVDSIKSVVIVTSDKCYLNDNKGREYKEEEILGGEDPYSVSKVCQEWISRCYQKSFFESSRRVGIATARACNLIGIGDFNRSRLLPYVLECFERSETARLRKPEAVRAWQFVLDVLWGYLLLAKKIYDEKENTSYNGSYNFGPTNGEYWNVEMLVRALANQFDHPAWMFEKALALDKTESMVLKLDSSKAKQVLSWAPMYTLDEVVAMIGEFSVRNKKGERFSELCGEWVADYFERLKLREKGTRI